MLALLSLLFHCVSPTSHTGVVAVCLRDPKAAHFCGCNALNCWLFPNCCFSFVLSVELMFASVFACPSAVFRFVVFSVCCLSSGSSNSWFLLFCCLPPCRRYRGASFCNSLSTCFCSRYCLLSVLFVGLSSDVGVIDLVASSFAVSVAHCLQKLLLYFALFHFFHNLLCGIFFLCC